MLKGRTIWSNEDTIFNSSEKTSGKKQKKKNYYTTKEEKTCMHILRYGCCLLDGSVCKGSFNLAYKRQKLKMVPLPPAMDLIGMGMKPAKELFVYLRTYIITIP